jgi:hypothetical protein
MRDRSSWFHALARYAEQARVRSERSAAVSIESALPMCGSGGNGSISMFR